MHLYIASVNITKYRERLNSLERKDSMSSSGFWKPADATVRDDGGRSAASGEAASAPFNFSRAPLAQQRMLLPIYKHKRQILYSLEEHGVVVIVGEVSHLSSLDDE